MPKNKKYDANDVSMPVPEYENFMQVLELPHALMGGTQAMRDKGKVFLPREDAEEDTSYKNRLNRSFLVNSFRRTTQKLTGEVFSKPIDIPDNMNEDITLWLEDIDLRKNNLTVFSGSCFPAGIVDGVVHVLVELPKIETEIGDDSKVYFRDYAEEDVDQTGEYTLRLLTQEAMREKGWRPYFVLIEAESLIGWRTEKVNGESVLSQIRILETSEEPDGKFGVKEVQRIRVMDKEMWQLYILQKNDRGEEEWVLESQGYHNRGYISLVSWFLGERKTEMTTEPPMMDLADLNLAHWQSSSDQRNILHYARLITYFGKRLGIEEDSNQKTVGENKAVIGANCLIHSNDEAADLKVVEHSGQAIEAGRNDLKDLEVQMRSYGLGLVMGQKSGTMTATEKAIDTAETDSTLKSWATSYESFINRCIAMAARIMNYEDIELPPVKVNTDFKSFLRSMEVKELREAYLDGILPHEVVFDEYQRRGIIKDDLDFADVMSMIQKEREAQTDFSRRTNFFTPPGSEEE